MVCGKRAAVENESGSVNEVLENDKRQSVKVTSFGDKNAIKKCSYWKFFGADLGILKFC